MSSFDVDAFLDGYQGVTVEVRIVRRADLIATHQKLDAKLATARAAASDDLWSPEVAALTRQIRELETEIEASEAVFHFRAVSKRQWQDLIRAHPPTKAQLEAEPGIDFNPETFPPAAIVACAIDPTLSTEQVSRLLDTVSFVEYQKLWKGVLEANLGVAVSPKSLLAAVIEGLSQNGESSTTAPPEASPAESS